MHERLGGRHQLRERRADAVPIRVAGGQHGHVLPGAGEDRGVGVAHRARPGQTLAADQRVRQRQMPRAADDQFGALQQARAAGPVRPSIPSSPIPTMASQGRRTSARGSRHS